MLYIILKGILIGLCISVPLGPIGMLCVQRTLNRGRTHGIVTGIGATTSDLVYTLITVFFLSFVIDFINDNKLIFQFIGSIIICLFGIFILRSNPSVQPKPNEISNHSLFGDFISSFGLTFSNPLILFILIALFARFQFISSDSRTIEILVGILSILLGAVLWWTTLTYIVSKFRNRLNMRELKIINHITGIVIVIIGIVGFGLSFVN